MSISLSWVEQAKIREIWPIIKEGIEAVEATTDAWIAEDIYMALKLGTCILHIGKLNGEYKGFIITQQQDNYGTITLHIWAAYSHGQDFDIIVDSTNQAIEWAKKIKAEKITFSSTRKGWCRKIKQMGFVQSPLITYEMKL